MKNAATLEPKKFSYSTNLTLHPLPELLYTIAQYKVPGVLTFTRENIVKQIFVNDGRVIFSASNAPEDHLGEFLFRCGKISRADYDRSAENIKNSKSKWQGEILVEMKALSKEELPWAVRSHQQAIVWSLFSWFEGNVAFNIGKFRQSKPIQLDIPIPRAVLDGVRHIQNAKRVITQMGNRFTVLESEENALLTIEIYGADDKEREVLKLVDGKTSLYDLCAHSPYSSHETAKVLYGLYSLKLVNRKEQQGVRIVSQVPENTF